MNIFTLNDGVPAMRQPVRFHSTPDTTVSPIPHRAADAITPTIHSGHQRPRPAVDSAVLRTNSAAVRAFLVVVVVIMLAMLAYLMSLSSHPSITDLVPKPGTASDPGLVTVQAHVGAAKPIQEVTLTIDGLTQTPAVVTLGDRSWIVRFQGELPRGAHKAVVSVRDSNGDQQTQSWSFDAAGPRVSPTITFSDPPSNATLPQGLLWIHANVQSDTDIASAILTINGQEIPVLLTPDTGVAAQTANDGTPSAVWIVATEHAFPAGTYVVNISATDVQGDKSTADWRFNVTNDPGKADARYFSSSKLYVSGKFLTFWEAHNGTLLFGDPVSTQFTNSLGTTVQYFEKARFEIDKTGNVTLGLLGDEAIGATQKRLDKPSGFDGLYFSSTGHTLAGKFKDFWQANGGVGIFGYPISEVLDQNGTKVQYFERSRFELSTDDSGIVVVKLTSLGSQLWAARGSAASP